MFKIRISEYLDSNKTMATKTAPKKTISFDTPVADPEKNFWLCDGRALRSLKELAEALETMDEVTWNFHVTSEKNDFANWIEGVFGQKTLGTAIRKSKTPGAAAKKLQVKFESPKFWSFLM